MSTYQQEISLCHFADVTRNPYDEPSTLETGWHYCSFCGAEARQTIFIPQLSSADFELMIRRFKDGDATYEEVADMIQHRMNKELNAFTKRVEEMLTSEKGATYKWRYDMNRQEWIEVGAHSALNNGSGNTTVPMPSPDLGEGKEK